MTPLENYGTLLNTEMSGESLKIFTEYLGYNLVNRNEYPELTTAETQVTSILGKMFGSITAEGTSTSGSTEAILLACLSAKLRYHSEGLRSQPNVIISHNSHSSWTKILKYLDIEVRSVDLSRRIFAQDLMGRCDQNTMLVIATDGHTVTGLRDDISGIAEVIHDSIEIFPRIRIHVDAAIGGFISPFQDTYTPYFKHRYVTSVNVSGHKYGLIYPGLGWIIWRSSLDVEEGLKFSIDYLSGHNSELNFSYSRSAAHIMALHHKLTKEYKSYYELVRWYDEVKENLAKVLHEHSPWEYDLWENEVPVLAWTFTENKNIDHSKSDSFMIEHGISIPNASYRSGSSTEQVYRMAIKWNHEPVTICEDLVNFLNYIK